MLWVLKQDWILMGVRTFENDVKMYGTQAKTILDKLANVFENDVKMYGTQAYQKPLCTGVTFENDVKMYGTQA